MHNDFSKSGCSVRAKKMMEVYGTGFNKEGRHAYLSLPAEKRLPEASMSKASPCLKYDLERNDMKFKIEKENAM